MNLLSKLNIEDNVSGNNFDMLLCKGRITALLFFVLLMPLVAKDISLGVNGGGSFSLQPFNQILPPSIDNGSQSSLHSSLGSSIIYRHDINNWLLEGTVGISRMRQSYSGFEALPFNIGGTVVEGKIAHATDISSSVLNLDFLFGHTFESADLLLGFGFSSYLESVLGSYSVIESPNEAFFEDGTKRVDFEQPSSSNQKDFFALKAKVSKDFIVGKNLQLRPYFTLDYCPSLKLNALGSEINNSSLGTSIGISLSYNFDGNTVPQNSDEIQNKPKPNRVIRTGTKARPPVAQFSTDVILGESQIFKAKRLRSDVDDEGFYMLMTNGMKLLINNNLEAIGAEDIKVDVIENELKQFTASTASTDISEAYVVVKIKDTLIKSSFADFEAKRLISSFRYRLQNSLKTRKVRYQLSTVLGEKVINLSYIPYNGSFDGNGDFSRTYLLSNQKEVQKANEVDPSLDYISLVENSEIGILASELLEFYPDFEFMAITLD